MSPKHFISGALAAILVVSSLTAVPYASAYDGTFTLSLNGTQEVPPNASPATRNGSFFWIDDDLHYDITVQNLTSPITAAHFHLGAAGASGPVLDGIHFDVNFATGTWPGLSPAMMQSVRDGNVYVDIHTAEYPDGEIRGQITLVDEAGGASSSSSSSSSASGDPSSSSSLSSSSADSSSSGGPSSPGVSSSSASSEAGASSSASAAASGGGGGSDALASIAGLSVIGDPGHGSHRGHGTNVAFGVAEFLAVRNGLGNGVAPGAFGGGAMTAPLTTAEAAYICGLQRAIPIAPPDGFVEAMAARIAQFLGRTPLSIVRALRDPVLCKPMTSALMQKAPVVQRLAPQIVYVSQRGYPISLRNPTWTKCVEGTATLRDIKMNPDRDERGRGYSCDRYSDAENMWRHPDFVSLVIEVDATNPEAPIVKTPPGYSLRTIPTVAAR